MSNALRSTDLSVEAVFPPPHPAQGLALFQALDDETALADVARNAKLWEVRLAAVQRVTDSALLERIAEATKHRDDRVYRYSYELLRSRRRDVARTTQAAQLAAGFRGLLDSPPTRPPLRSATRSPGCARCWMRSRRRPRRRPPRRRKRRRAKPRPPSGT